MASPYDVLPDDFRCAHCVARREACLSDCSGRAEVICNELAQW